MNTLNFYLKLLSGFAGIGLIAALLSSSKNIDNDEKATDWDKMECDWDI